MNELSLPQSDEELTKRLREIHGNRRTDKARRKLEEKEQERRRRLTADERQKVLDKTGGHCHLCGGDMKQSSGIGELQDEQEIELHFVVTEEAKSATHFVVDHIVPVASGGQHSLDNLLPAHGLCNGCRWFYSPEEFQWILRMGDLGA